MIKDNNFVSSSTADEVEDFVFGPSIPWTLYEETVKPENKKNLSSEATDHFQLVHLLYSDQEPKSQFFNDFHNLFLEFINKHEVEYRAMMRMKVNLIPKTGEDTRYMPPHVDAKFDHKVFIYYINDSDGDTLFFKDDKIIDSVSPKKGLGIMFDGNTYHANRLPIKNKFRSVLNVAFL